MCEGSSREMGGGKCYRQMKENGTKLILCKKWKRKMQINVFPDNKILQVGSPGNNYAS